MRRTVWNELARQEGDVMDIRRMEQKLEEGLAPYVGYATKNILESLNLLENANSMPLCDERTGSIQGIVTLAYDYIDMVDRYEVLQNYAYCSKEGTEFHELASEMETKASVALEDAKIAVFLYVLETGGEVFPPELPEQLTKNNLAGYMAAYPAEATEVMCECAYNRRNNVNLVFDAKGKLLMDRSTGDKDIMQKVMDSFEDMKDKVFAEEEKVLSEHEGERE